MPTVFRWNGYRFYFFSHEGSEPPHVHVDKAGRSAKFWLTPVALARNFGYSDRELNAIRDTIENRREEILRVWHEHFHNNP